MSRKKKDWPVPKWVARLIYGADIVLRLSSIVVVLRNPLLGSLLILLLDAGDYEVAVSAGVTYKKYQMIDKTLDMINMFYLTVSSFSLNLSIKYFILALFFYRSIGQVVYFYNRKDKYFIYFPNLIDFFFPIYLLSNSLVFSLIVSLPLKIIQEYILHVRHYTDPLAMTFVRAHPEHQLKNV